MKRYTFGIVASLSASLFMAVPAMAQYSSYAECTAYYEAHYYQQLAYCSTQGFGDPWLREICDYQAGMERDQNMNYCSQAYPENVSQLIAPTSPWTRSEFAQVFRESSYSELLARTAAKREGARGDGGSWSATTPRHA